MRGLLQHHYNGVFNPTTALLSSPFHLKLFLSVMRILKGYITRCHPFASVATAPVVPITNDRSECAIEQISSFYRPSVSIHIS
jgi:hypothetical protein